MDLGHALGELIREITPGEMDVLQRGGEMAMAREGGECMQLPPRAGQISEAQMAQRMRGSIEAPPRAGRYAERPWTRSIT